MLHLPRYPKEVFLFGLFWIGGVWTIVYETCIVMPYYHREFNIAVMLHLTSLAFLACIIYSNMYCLISTDVSIKQIKEPHGTLDSGWRYCEKCSCNTPPRSHHCKICDTCILKRDHHCWFAGYCVGFNNHRYFVALALYTSIAGVYANIYNWDFFLNYKGGFAWTTILSLIAPHVGMMLGYYTILEFALTVNTSVGLFFTIFFIWLLCSQVLQMVSGQVMYERRKEIYDYNLGLRNSINEIFGSAGLLGLLCPFLPTRLSGDGTVFPKQADKTN